MSKFFWLVFFIFFKFKNFLFEVLYIFEEDFVNFSYCLSLELKIWIHPSNDEQLLSNVKVNINKFLRVDLPSCIISNFFKDLSKSTDFSTFSKLEFSLWKCQIVIFISSNDQHFRQVFIEQNTPVSWNLSIVVLESIVVVLMIML